MLIDKKNYKLYKGDCLEVMDKLIKEGVKVDMVLTDPPYGRTQNKWDSIIPLEPMWQKLELLTKPNTAILLFAQTPFDKVLGCSNLKMLKYEWIWEKTTATGYLNAKKMPMKAHENILVFYKKLPTYNPQKTTGHKPTNYFEHKTNNISANYGTTNEGFKNGGSTERYPRSIQVFKSDKQKCTLHPTQKPVALLEYLIKTYTNEGELVLDFTMGSGSTGVACLNTNRRFIGIELDEKYFNIAKDRLENIK